VGLAHALLGPVKLDPIPVGRPWGGLMLCQKFQKPRPSSGEPLGESWEASDLDGAVSKLGSGPLAGTPVNQVFGEPLPLLIKLLDAREWLSVQVHPDDTASKELSAQRSDGRLVQPKNEAWHILWAEPGAEIIYGARPGVTSAELMRACAAGGQAMGDVLHRIRVHVGDTIFVPAGTVHAIGPGIMLYEVQQPSNATLRLYDWNRVGADGKARKLHLEQAATALRGPQAPDPRRETALTPGPNPRINLLKTPYFRLDLFLVDLGELVIPEKKQMTFLTATAGSGWIQADAGQVELGAGDTVLIPSGVDYCLLPGDRGLRVIRAVPGANKGPGAAKEED
jgi:mannose-6-phosphate isomerase